MRLYIFVLLTLATIFPLATTTTGAVGGVAWAQEAQFEYVIGGTPNQVPAGYVPATLADVQSRGGGFITEYTSFGISLPDEGRQSPVTNPYPGCGYIAVQEGLLATGTFLSKRYFTVYFQNGTEQSGSSSIYGPAVFFGLTNPNNFLGASWNSSFGSNIYTTTKEGCSAQDGNVWMIYRRALYVVAEYSPDNTAPAGSNAILASIDEIKNSAHFAAWYNSQGGVEGKPAGSGIGLPIYSGSTGDLQNFCCVFRLASGYLNYGGSGSGATPVQPYSASTRDNLCPIGSYGSDTFTGTVAFGLEGINNYLGSLNYTTRANFASGSGSSSLPAQCLNNNAQRTLGIFKVHSLPTAPTPEPGPRHHCYEVELRVSYYLPNTPICLADRWRHIMRINETYDTIGMTSIDECGFTVNMHGITIEPYDNTHAKVSSTGGASNCPCHGYKLVPYNFENRTEMSTICTYRPDEFHFCSLLIEFDKSGRSIKCP